MNPSVEELGTVPVLASLSADELEGARRYFTVRSYPKNAIFATEGDQLEFFYLILSGSAQAFWRDEEGHQLKLGIDNAGAHFPDSSLTGEPVAVSYVALSDLRLACIRLADFKRLMQGHPRIAEVMLIVERLTHSEIGQRIGATREMVGRVLRELAKGGYIRTEPERIAILRKLPARW